MFLTREEVEELTGYEVPGWQCRWLDAHGYRYEKSAIGRPVVLKAHVAAKLSGHEQKREITMNLDAIRKRA